LPAPALPAKILTCQKILFLMEKFFLSQNTKFGAGNTPFGPFWEWKFRGQNEIWSTHPQFSLVEIWWKIASFCPS